MWKRLSGISDPSFPSLWKVQDRRPRPAGESDSKPAPLEWKKAGVRKRSPRESEDAEVTRSLSPRDADVDEAQKSPREGIGGLGNGLNVKVLWRPETVEFKKLFVEAVQQQEECIAIERARGGKLSQNVLDELKRLQAIAESDEPSQEIKALCEMIQNDIEAKGTLGPLNIKRAEKVAIESIFNFIAIEGTEQLIDPKSAKFQDVLLAKLSREIRKNGSESRAYKELTELHDKVRFGLVGDVDLVELCSRIEKAFHAAQVEEGARFNYSRAKSVLSHQIDCFLKEKRSSIKTPAFQLLHNVYSRPFRDILQNVLESLELECREHYREDILYKKLCTIEYRVTFPLGHDHELDHLATTIENAIQEAQDSKETNGKQPLDYGRARNIVFNRIKEHCATRMSYFVDIKEINEGIIEHAVDLSSNVFQNILNEVGLYAECLGDDSNWSAQVTILRNRSAPTRSHSKAKRGYLDTDLRGLSESIGSALREKVPSCKDQLLRFDEVRRVLFEQLLSYCADAEKQRY